MLPSELIADVTGYNRTLNLRIESDNFIVIHFHDWTSKTKDSRYKMISTNQDPFTNENNYAYIVCIDKKTRDTIFKKPCPALTRIEISPDEKYIIGISKVLLWNPYHLVIYDTRGKLAKKRNISDQEAKLSANDLLTFKEKYLSQYHFLDSIKRVYKINDYYFIDFSSMGMPDKLGEAWRYLFKYISPNHLSKNFSESVTNWVFWFNEEAPDIKFIYVNSKLFSVSILDPAKTRFEIKINE